MSKIKKTRRKWIIWMIIFVVSLLLLHLIVNFFFNIHYSGTFFTKYIKKGENQIIITEQFEMETPGNWWHLFHGYGTEGEAYGYFFTLPGEKIHYEYGIFANDYSLDSISVCEIDSVLAGRFEVYIGKSCDKGIGVYIPRQYEMEFSLSFFIEDGNEETLSTILSSIEGMVFKQFYFFWPELDKAIAYFKESWSEEQLEAFKNEPEEDAVIALHRSVGTWIRNNWLRNNEDSSLVDFFHSVDIYAYDDMSSIILTSLHRSLNGKWIDLYGQTRPFIEYWGEIEFCKEKLRQEAQHNFNTFSFGDRIQIYMPSLSENEKNAVYFLCPDVEWEFVPERDLLFEGLIIHKFEINSPSNVFFKVQLLGMNHKNVEILSEAVLVGDTIDLSLHGLRIRALD